MTKSKERHTSRSGSRNRVTKNDSSYNSLYSSSRGSGFNKEARYCAFTTLERSCNKVVLSETTMTGRYLNELIAENKDLPHVL